MFLRVLYYVQKRAFERLEFIDLDHQSQREVPILGKDAVSAVLCVRSQRVRFLNGKRISLDEISPHIGIS